MLRYEAIGDCRESCQRYGSLTVGGGFAAFATRPPIYLLGVSF